MVQISFLSGARLPVLDSAVAGAVRIAEAVRRSPSGRAYSGSEDDGAAVFSDRQHVAASGRFAAEAEAQSAAAANAVGAASLLQVADDALLEIGDGLDRLAALAQQAMGGGLSDLERAQLDREFQSVKSEIDAIAATAEFNGTFLLQGGSGPGGALEISFKIGTGAADEDEVTISIAPASVAALSTGLADGDVTTFAGAVAAEGDTAAAADAVAAIRARIAGDRARFAAAWRNSQSMQQAASDTRRALTSPTVAVDLSRVLAARVAEEGGIALTEQSLDRLRRLLIGLDLPSAAPAGASEVSDDTAPAPAPDRNAGGGTLAGGRAERRQTVP